ncbi:MAG: hypothetical protein QW393_03150 [Candidatus Micrarchaeaceae archaeon]
MKNKKGILALLLIFLMFGSVFFASAYAAVAPPPYSASYTETGLPAGATFTVSLKNSTLTATSPVTSAGSTATISSLYNGTYVLSAAATPGSGHKYSALVWNPPSSTTVGISGPPSTGSLSFSEEFSLNATSSGLPDSYSWALDLVPGAAVWSNGIGNVLTNLKNGSYAFFVIAPPGYTASPSSGTVAINGENASVHVTFTGTGSGKEYPLVVSETGLPAGTSWYLSVGSQQVVSNTASNFMFLFNGTYSYNIPSVGHYFARVPSGTFTIQGKSLNLNVSFVYGYPVTFSANGISKNVPWSVTYGGVTNSSTSGTIGFNVANGSYTFSVSVAPNWVATPEAGYLNVSGAPITKTINFTEVFYRVQLTETGLPSGSLWTVTINGQIYQTTNGSIIISAHNGTFNVIPATVPGYGVSPGSISVVLGYSSVVRDFTYTKTINSTTTGSGGGFTFPTTWTGFISSYYFYGAVGLLVIIFLALGLMGRGGKRKRTRKRTV